MGARGPYQAAFLIAPTTPAELQAVVRGGEVLPQKSTHFYPEAARRARVPPARRCVMRAIGVDLAWSARNRSGLCALEDGRVLGSAASGPTTRSTRGSRVDEGERELVAIDAPLMVANRTGRRPCEAVIAAAGRSAHAGAVSGHLDLLHRDGVRARRLARRLGLHARRRQPSDGARPRAAVEVFPHSALVVAVRSRRAFAVQGQAGPAAGVRRAACDELLAGLARWPARRPSAGRVDEPDAGTRLQARGHARPGRLAKRLEDELDAYVCAYVAIYHRRWHGRRSLAVGDGRAGISSPRSSARRRRPAPGAGASAWRCRSPRRMRHGEDPQAAHGGRGDQQRRRREARRPLRKAAAVAVIENPFAGTVRATT